MKKPEEIKKGLEYCIGDDEDFGCDGCAYCGEMGCVDKMTYDAMIYIQQLEAERDAAVADVKSLCATNYFSGDFCAYCKHNEPDGQCHHPCQPYSNKWGWEWRGVQKEETK